MYERKQCVCLNRVYSNTVTIEAGVPQGSILGPLLFLIYINDIVSDITSNVNLFADDTSLFMVVENPIITADILNDELQKINSWANKWFVTFNQAKTESMLISKYINKPDSPPLFMKNQQITEVPEHKHLGVILSNDCSWSAHIKYVTEKAWKRINVIRSLKFTLNRRSLETIYLSFIRPLLEYGDVIFDNLTNFKQN